MLVQDYTGRLYDCDFNQQLATQMLLKNSSNHTQVQSYGNNISRTCVQEVWKQKEKSGVVKYACWTCCFLHSIVFKGCL